ncbi:hypothetical protein CTEN210_16855 [Chaetoceros tenuissimus]|uniref:Uncharacterized protein n=1 Tax=Chaetoceros tenuissimus TaxID=426638 RepID=A0AAD3HEN7_9STRA|nr:hypothetical protein CTEN210_16855 [Chaetoceros tenuissimus]
MSFLLKHNFRSNKSNGPASTSASGNNNRPNQFNSRPNANRQFASKQVMPQPATRRGGVNAGGGQVQIQRPGIQKTAVSSNEQQLNPAQRNQALQRMSDSNQTQNSTQQQNVISMDEVMEDLRILEQQQRDSQQQLATIKVTKQHKLDQRSMFESKLSALKYSNGELRFQLNHARTVLSKIQRELATAKISSERSNNDLKKFDEKLKATLDIVNKLHNKRRNLDGVIARLENKCDEMQQREKSIEEQVKNVKGQVESVVHQEKLLAKDVQDIKNEKQQCVSALTQMRTDSVALDRELTNVQQLEVETKIALEQKRADLQSERERFDVAKNTFMERTNLVDEETKNLEQALLDIEKQVAVHNDALKVAFEKCIEIQKEEMLDVSTNMNDARLDLESARARLDDEKAELASYEMEADLVKKDHSVLQLELENFLKQNQEIEQQMKELKLDLQSRREVEISKGEERKQEFAKIEEAKKVLSTHQEQVKALEENEASHHMNIEQQKEVLDSSFADKKVKLSEIVAELDSMQDEIATLKEEYEVTKTKCAEQIASARSTELDAKQSLENAKKLLENKPDLESLAKSEQAERDLIEEINAKKQTILSNYPFLSSIDLSSDPNQSREAQIEESLYDLREFCRSKLDNAKAAYEDRCEKFKEAKEQEKIESMMKEELEKNKIDEEEDKSEVKSKSILKERNIVRKRKVDPIETDDESVDFDADMSPVLNRNKKNARRGYGSSRGDEKVSLKGSSSRSSKRDSVSSPKSSKLRKRSSSRYSDTPSKVKFQEEVTVASTYDMDRSMKKKERKVEKPKEISATKVDLFSSRESPVSKEKSSSSISKEISTSRESSSSRSKSRRSDSSRKDKERTSSSSSVRSKSSTKDRSGRSESRERSSGQSRERHARKERSTERTRSDDTSKSESLGRSKERRSSSDSKSREKRRGESLSKRSVADVESSSKSEDRALKKSKSLNDDGTIGDRRKSATKTSSRGRSETKDSSRSRSDVKSTSRGRSQTKDSSSRVRADTKTSSRGRSETKDASRSKSGSSGSLSKSKSTSSDKTKLERHRSSSKDAKTSSSSRGLSKERSSSSSKSRSLSKSTKDSSLSQATSGSRRRKKTLTKTTVKSGDDFSFL